MVKVYQVIEDAGGDGVVCWERHSPVVVLGGRGRCNAGWTCLGWSVYRFEGSGSGDRIARIG